MSYMWLDKVLYEWKVETGIRVRCYLTINYLKVRRELPISRKGERLGEGNFFTSTFLNKYWAS